LIGRTGIPKASTGKKRGRPLHQKRSQKGEKKDRKKLCVGEANAVNFSVWREPGRESIRTPEREASRQFVRPHPQTG